MSQEEGEVDLLQAVQDWYATHCNGAWEHTHGIKIVTCDNPGWWVTVDLTGTELQTCPYASVAMNVDADGVAAGHRWLFCRVENAVWNGAGDETKLPAILAEFLSWATGSVR
jgi:hypothetical protein